MLTKFFQSLGRTMGADAALEEQEAEAAQLEARREYLEASHAYPTSMEAFGLWYKTYLQQNSNQFYTQRDYPSTIGDRDKIEFWTPTTPAPIPSLTGKARLKLLILTPHVYKTEPAPANPGHSAHDAWGENVLLFLSINKNGTQASARTNRPTDAWGYRNVEAYCMDKSIQQLFKNMLTAEKH